MLFKVKEAVRNGLICLFMAKKNQLQQLADTSFSPESYTQKHIANTTIITRYEKDDDVRFFRECRRHAPLRQYVLTAIDEYFDRISTCAAKAELKAAVLQDLRNKANYKRLVDISAVFNRHLTEILCGVYNDYAAAGLPCFNEVNEQVEFIAFIKYISGIVISQKTNAYLPNGAFENYSANKQLATYRLACLWGVEELITPVTVCAFSQDGVTRVGTMMEKAPGYPPSDITPEQRTTVCVPSFLKSLTTLEYLDALCYQLDHRLDNYYVVENTKGEIARVVAFDNDAARTFFISPSLPKKTYAGCVGVVNGGVVARPFMDRAFAQRICRCTKRQLTDAVGELMSRYQLHCLWKRVCALRKAIERTSADTPEFLVSDWTTVSPETAADDRYGCTYYRLYLTDTLMLDRNVLFEEMQRKQN